MSARIEVDVDGLPPDAALAKLVEAFVAHVGTAQRTQLAFEDVLSALVRRRAVALLSSRRSRPHLDRPARSRRYLDFVGEQPCCCCGVDAPSDPHHAGRRGVGQKATDYSAVPLCRRCHDGLHAGNDPRPAEAGGVLSRRSSIEHHLTCAMARSLAAYAQALEGA